MNGTDEERHLVNSLAALGWEGVRAPASGTAPRSQPDALMAKDAVILNGELKSGGPPNNVDAYEVDDLRTFGWAFGAADILAARYKDDRTFYLADVDRVEQTDSGKYSTKTKPESFPWGVAIDYTIREDDDGAPVYDVDVIQEMDPVETDHPVKGWVRFVRDNQQDTREPPTRHD